MDSDTSGQHKHTKHISKKLALIKRHRRRLAILLARLVGVAVIFFIFALAYAYMSTPAAIRRPAVQHYHFRMQIIAGNQTVNFSNTAFQEGYAKDTCNAGLTKNPIHFHDNRDQMVHVHWDGMTGGLVLKYYGWNYIGSMDTILGYRFDQLPNISKAAIHGNVLPALPKDATFYVFSGDEKGYEQRSWKDFLKQDLEVFFNKQSNIGQQASLLDTLFPKAYAHAGHSHGTTNTDPQPATAPTNEDNLERINNLLGNVVIFAQKEAPSEKDIQARFNNLTPLENSTCGG